MDELPQKSTALRGPKGIGIAERTGTGIPVRRCGVLQEGDDVTHGSESKSADIGAVCGIEDLIELASLKTRLEADIVRMRLALNLHKGPCITVYWSSRCIRVVTYLQDGVWVVDIYSRMRQVLTVGEIKHRDAFIGLELAEHFSNQRRTGWAERFRCLQAHQTRGRGHIRLPATLNDRVALAHQEAITWIKWRCGVEGPWTIVKIRQDF